MNPHPDPPEAEPERRPEAEGFAASLVASGHKPLAALLSATIALHVPPAFAADPSKDGGGAAAATVATATIPLSTSPVCVTFYSDSPRVFDDLLDAYERGSPAALQTQLTEIATVLEKAIRNPSENPTKKEFCPGPGFSSKDRISFVFVDDHAVQPLIVRVLQGASPTPSPGSVRLVLDAKKCTVPKTGAERGWACPLYTIYLFRNTSTAPIASSYSASPSLSPIQAGLNQIVSALVTAGVKVPAPAATTASEKALAPTEEPAKHSVAVIMETLVPADLKWAQITVTDRVDLRGFLETEKLKSRAERLCSADPCKELITKLDCQMTKWDGNKEKKPKLSDLQGLLAASLRNACDLKTYTKLQSVYEMYAARLLDQTTDTTTQTVYTYGKLTTVTFGLGVGAIVDFNHNEQVKISDGTLILDTPNGVMTSANLYVSVLGGYDESTLTASGAEKSPRLVVGPVITPNFGGFVGIAQPLSLVWSELRKFTLNGGYALMLATVPASSSYVGGTEDAAKTKRGGLGGWFVTLGYTF